LDHPWLEELRRWTQPLVRMPAVMLSMATIPVPQAPPQSYPRNQ